MLSIIQPVAPSWASLPDGEPAHWSYTVGESQAEAEGKKRNIIKNNGKRRTTNQVENKEERSR